MTGALANEPSWTEFIGAISEVGALPLDLITPTSRLVEDLGLDSLALVELILAAAEIYGDDIFSDRLEKNAWKGLTVEQAFRECASATSRSQPLQPPRQ